MRTYEEIESTARDERPFSNGTEWEIWASGWCWAPCMNPAELAWQRYEMEQGPAPTEFPGGCPLILCAMNGKTPIEWVEQPEGSRTRFRCTEFRDEEQISEAPVPDDPNQCALFEVTS